MQISSQSHFDGDPTQVHGLLTDQAFLEAVCVASHALSHDVTVEGDTTTTTQELPAPDVAANFVGKTITVVQRVEWHAPSADGSRTGDITMTVPKQPVQLRGTLALSPDGAGSVLDLTGDLKVSIPLLGKKLEQASAPAILAGFRQQEKTAREWLPR